MNNLIDILIEDIENGYLNASNAEQRIIDLFTTQSTISIGDALAFSEYFRNHFDYYDCNSNGRLYKWIDSNKRGQPAMSMNQIFDHWRENQIENE